MSIPLKLPSKCTVNVEKNPDIKVAHKQDREWCGSVVGTMVWLSSILPDATYVFRGQADATWPLESSLQRAKKPSTLKKLEAYEESVLGQISSDFWFRRQFGFNPAADSKSDRYQRTVAALQHHGVPTRLLDVTADPLVGLYFAVVARSAVSDMDGVDGAVLFIRDVNEAAGLPVHVILAPQISERVTAQRSRFIAPVVGAAAGAAATGTVAFDFANVDVKNGSGTDFDRLIAKFLTGDFSGRPPEKAPNLLKFVVPGSLKPACREVLRSMGVSARTLFPGGEGFSKDIAGF